MRKTNLAYALDAADAALQREQANPSVTEADIRAAKEKALKVVAGIDSFDAVAEQASLDETRKVRRAAIASYYADKAALEAKLNAAGVTYLGIAPTAYWNKLSREAGIIRLQPGADGSVRVSETAFADIPAVAGEHIGQRPLRAMITGGSIGFLATTGLMQYFDLLTLGWSLIPAAVVVPIAGFFSGEASRGWNYFGSSRQPKSGVMRRAERKVARQRFHDQAKAKKMLWPDGVEPKDGPKLKIGLPDAPADVQANLARAARAGLPLELATAPEAVMFKDSPVQAFLDARAPAYDKVARDEKSVKDANRARRAARMRDFRAMFQSDPIATTHEGRATAIIIQYGGDYPAEKALVDKVLANPTTLV